MEILMTSCSSSTNVLCKHPLATRTFYVDLSFMPAGVTVSSSPAPSGDSADVVVESVSILGTDLTVGDCGRIRLTANRALLVVVSGGTSSDDEAEVTVTWTQSDGDVDVRTLRLLVQ
jgi:hypothetical protein